MSKRVVVTCNIDRYRFAFTGFDAGGYLPQEGHYIAVSPNFVSVMEAKRFPTELLVERVTHEYDRIVIKVHYSKFQIDSLTAAKINAYS